MRSCWCRSRDSPASELMVTDEQCNWTPNSCNICFLRKLNNSTLFNNLSGRSKVGVFFLIRRFFPYLGIDHMFFLKGFYPF
jgi:hypothetical protein